MEWKFQNWRKNCKTTKKMHKNLRKFIKIRQKQHTKMEENSQQ